MSMTEDQGDDDRAFRILSLDGGGIRGAFTAAFVADLEERMGCRVCEYFDLIAGTSTGGIIAAALASGEPAERIVEFYRKSGPAIFRRESKGRSLVARCRAWICRSYLKRAGIDDAWLWNPKYEAAALRSALEEVFGARTLEDVRGSRVVIPAVDLTKGQPVVFKTPHLPGLVRDRRFRIVDVLLATTAAPTYFPHAVIGTGSAYVDGGVWANNPTMVAVAEAIRISKDCVRPEFDPKIRLEKVAVLSVGTGRLPYFARPPEGGGGIAWWLAPLIELVSVSQALGVHFQSQAVLGDRYRRVDFPLPDASWKLDCIAVVDQLIHLGREQVAENLTELRRSFFSEKVPPYQPFDSPVEVNVG